MAEYTDRIAVAAQPAAVFEFVSDIGNLPKYLPTVHGAHTQGVERVEVDGKANGHSYHSDGWFKVDAASQTMSWGSDGENEYSGKMTVTGKGAGSEVECALRFTPKPDIEDAMDKNQGGASAAMTEGLRASLQSIKQICEGTGGKEPTRAD
jgi:carbon monoxide dehydrogenase subunit G